MGDAEAVAAAAVEIPFAREGAAILRMCGAEAIPGSDKEGTMMAAMARRSGLSRTPHFGILEDEFNAMAVSTGGSDGLVLIGRPLQDVLAPDEIRAVIGHEIGHLAMGDSRRKLLAMGHQQFLVVFLGFAGLRRLALRSFGLIGELALAGLSREREYWADAVGAYLVSPEAMIRALRKIEATDPPPPTKTERAYDALMFRGPFSYLLSTHPTMDQRVRALEEATYIRRLPIVEAAAGLTPAPQLATDGI